MPWLTTHYDIGSESVRERHICELPTTIEQRSFFYTVIRMLPAS